MFLPLAANERDLAPIEAAQAFFAPRVALLEECGGLTQRQRGRFSSRCNPQDLDHNQSFQHLQAAGGRA
jgi:hypothetical protein